MRLATLVVALGIAAGVVAPAAAVEMMPIPPLPMEGEPFSIFIRDAKRAYPRDGPYAFVQDAKSPFDQRQASVASAGDLVVLTLPHGLPAGRYVVTYYDLPFCCSYQDDPKSEMHVFVSAKGPVSVVEYYDAALDRYFLASDPAEIVAVDSGALGAWQRTGQIFRALPPDETGYFAARVCRFYGLPAAGLDAHFYSADPFECARVAAQWPGRWVLESEAAFGAMLRVAPYQCEGPMRRLYRLFNGTNSHRYTTSPVIRDQMVARGWTLEASLRDPEYGLPYTMCVLAPEPEGSP